VTDDVSSSNSSTSISGGINLDADRIDIGGDVVGRDKIVSTTYFTGDQQYDVRGLVNPYLGLQSFTYADHAKYAGREKLIADTVAQLTAPDDPLALLFVTGASGSGKSSFGQAGVLPALEQHYATLSVKYAVFRPSRDPLAALVDALWRQLGLPQIDARTDFGDFLRSNTPSQQVNAIVIDQFEELFTQSAAQSRDALFTLLTHLPPFRATRTHFIATMRADYLPELFALPALYDIAKRGIELRAMSIDELSDAIQQPLRVTYADKDKRLQTELIERLAQDAAEDAAYLPLLQVTLEEIWRKGTLTLGAYTNLSDAIEQRADKVLVYEDYDAPQPHQARSADQQSAILDLCLNLVDVSLDDQARRDVRRRRSKDELSHGAPERARLVNVLTQARLLSVDQEEDEPTRVEVDLIHETLLTNWDRLRQAIAERRHELRQRARFEQQLQDWIGQNRSDDYLLSGVRLAEAKDLERRDDVALLSSAARDFIQRSVEREEARRQKELDDARRLAEAERLRAEEQQRSAAKLRRVAIMVGILALAAAMLGLLAGVFGIQSNQAANANATLAAQKAAIAATAEADANRAEKASRVAQARQLIAQSQSVIAKEPLLGLRLGLEALAIAPMDDNSTRDMAARLVSDQAATGRSSRIDLDNTILESTDSELASYFLSYQASRPSGLWRVIDGQQLVTFTNLVNSARFSRGPDARYLAIHYASGISELRRTLDGSVVFTLPHQAEDINHPAPQFSPDQAGSFYQDSGDVDTDMRQLRWSASGSPVLTSAHRFLGVLRYIPPVEPKLFIASFENAPYELHSMVDGAFIETLPGISDVVIGPGKESAYFFLTGDYDGSPASQLRRVSDGRLIEQLPAPIRTTYFSPEPSARYFLADFGGAAPNELRYTADGTRAMNLTNDLVSAVIFAANPNAVYFGVQYPTWSELRRMSDGSQVAVLDGQQLTKLSFSSNSSAPYFVAAGTGTSQRGELRRVSDASFVAELPHVVYEVYFSPDPDLPYFVINYEGAPSEIRRISDGSVVSMIPAGAHPYFSRTAGAKFFIMDQGPDWNAPGELRSAATGQVIERLPDTVNKVYFPDTNVPYFLVRYTAAPSELRDGLTGQVISTLPDQINDSQIGSCIHTGLCLAGPYLWLAYENGGTELWKWSSIPHRIVDLGRGVIHKVFDPSTRQLFVHYSDGRAYFLDLNWLNELDGKAASMPLDNLVHVTCQMLAAHRFDETALTSYLGDQSPHACR